MVKHKHSNGNRTNLGSLPHNSSRFAPIAPGFYRVISEKVLDEVAEEPTFEEKLIRALKEEQLKQALRDENLRQSLRGAGRRLAFTEAQRRNQAPPFDLKIVDGLTIEDFLQGPLAEAPSYMFRGFAHRIRSTGYGTPITILDGFSTDSGLDSETPDLVISQVCVEVKQEPEALRGTPLNGLLYVPTMEGTFFNVKLPGDDMVWRALGNPRVTVSMVRKLFYDSFVAGKTFPWVGDEFAVKYGRRSLCPIAPGSRFPGMAEAGIAVYGLVPIPVCMTDGHPTMIQCLVVDDLFPAYIDEQAKRIDMVIGADYYIRTQIGTASLPKNPAFAFRDLLPSKPAHLRYIHGTIVMDICEHIQNPLGQTFDPIVRERRKQSFGQSHEKKLVLTPIQQAEIRRKTAVLEARLAEEGREGTGGSIHQGISIAFAYQSCLNRSMDLTTGGKLLTYIACAAGTSYCHELAYYIFDRRDLICAGLAIYYALRLRANNGYYFESIKINTTSNLLVEDMTNNVAIWERYSYCDLEGEPIPNRAMYAFLHEYVRKEHVFVYYAAVGKTDACQKVACYLTNEANELALDGAVYKTDMNPLTERDRAKPVKKPLLSRLPAKTIVIEDAACQMMDPPVCLRFKTCEFIVNTTHRTREVMKLLDQQMRRPTGGKSAQRSSHESVLEWLDNDRPVIPHLRQRPLTQEELQRHVDSYY